MTIADAKFVAELITSKGRIYKFDDIHCMMEYAKANAQLKDAKYYIADFSAPENFIISSDAYYIKGDNVKSPMGGNIAAFADKEAAHSNGLKLGATEISWEAINK